MIHPSPFVEGCGQGSGDGLEEADKKRIEMECNNSQEADPEEAVKKWFDLSNYTVYQKTPDCILRESLTSLERTDPDRAKKVKGILFHAAQFHIFRAKENGSERKMLRGTSFSIENTPGFIHVYDRNRIDPQSRKYLNGRIAAGVKWGWGSAYSAAVAAREHIVDGGCDETLSAFIEEWITSQKREAVRDAVVAALLEDEWLNGPRKDDQFLPEFKRKVWAHHAVWRPLWERQLNHSSINSLSDLLGPGGDSKATLSDAIHGGESPEYRFFHPITSPLFPGHAERALLPVLDERVRRNVLKLSREERRTVFSWASDPWDGERHPWVEAARCAGHNNPELQGQRVRRKIRRLGKEDRRRRQ